MDLLISLCVFINNSIFVCVCVCVRAQSCLTLCDLRECSPPVSSVHGTLQARILELVTISSSGGSSPLRDWTQVSCISCTGMRILYHWATREASIFKQLQLICWVGHIFFFFRILIQQGSIFKEELTTNNIIRTGSREGKHDVVGERPILRL